AHLVPGLVDALAVQLRVRAGEVDELEDAQRRLRRRIPAGPQAALVDDHELARLDLADERGADDVEGAGLRRQGVAVWEAAKGEGPEPAGIPGAEEGLLVHQHEREGPLELGESAEDPLRGGVL